MFHKPNSSTHSRGKKAKDVPLRKSDRRALRQLVGDCFCFCRNSTNGGVVEGQDDEQDTNYQAYSMAMNQLLDVIFLQGTLLSRTIELPPSSSSASTSTAHSYYYKSCTLYYRSPEESSSTTDSSPLSSISWPYTRHAQCVWIQVLEQDARQASQSTTHQVPGLALLSVVVPVSMGTRKWQQKHYYSVFSQVLLNNAGVSEFLCRGAHLMRSGMRVVAGGSPTMTTSSSTTSNNREQPPIESNNHQRNRSSRVALVGIRNNPQCLAVGILLGPSSSQQQQQQDTRSGVGVHIVSCYGDDLWKQQNVTNGGANSLSSTACGGPVNELLGGGARYNDGHYGNAGFVDGKYVVPIFKSDQSAPHDEDVDSEEDDEEDVLHARVGVAELAAVADEGTNERPLHETDPDESETGPAHVNVVGEPSQGDKGYFPSSAKSDEDANTSLLSPDNVLHAAVCKALSKLQPKRDLPMTMANFYAQHVIPNRPDKTLIELKQTKWKKFGAYVKEQVEDGLLLVGPDETKKDSMAMLVGFHANRDASIKSFREQAKLDGSDNAMTDSRLVISDLYIVPPHIVTLLQLDKDDVKAANATSEERKNTGMLTLKEVRTILEKYIEQEELLSASRPGMVNLNGPLVEALYGKHNKQDTPDSLSRKDLASAWLAKMQRAYALVQIPGNRVLKLARGSPPTIQITVTKRQNKKFVTRIRGLEEYGIHAPSFCTDVSHRFACSGSMEENPDTARKKGHVELQFQGNLADEIEALLLGDASLTSHGGAQNSEYRIPKGCVEVVLRKGVPARKKQATAGGGGGSTKKK